MDSKRNEERQPAPTVVGTDVVPDAPAGNQIRVAGNTPRFQEVYAIAVNAVIEVFESLEIHEKRFFQIA
jgi:hypothetical protein